MRPAFAIKNRTDVLLAVFAPGTQVAGVFTKSKTASAPVRLVQEQPESGQARALVVNSGNANAFTGKAGFDGARARRRIGRGLVGCTAIEVFMASTGVIGEPLPAENITKSSQAWCNRHPLRAGAPPPKRS